MKNKKKKIITSVDIQNELNSLINKVKMMEDGKGENEQDHSINNYINDTNNDIDIDLNN